MADTLFGLPFDAEHQQWLSSMAEHGNPMAAAAVEQMSQRTEEPCASAQAIRKIIRQHPRLLRLCKAANASNNSTCADITQPHLPSTSRLQKPQVFQQIRSRLLQIAVTCLPWQ